MTTHASGTFEVKLNPQVDDKVGDPTVGRMSIDKQFHGDLEATSKGQMLATRTVVEGSAGYVAMERVNGTLNQRTLQLRPLFPNPSPRGRREICLSRLQQSGWKITFTP